MPTKTINFGMVPRSSNDAEAAMKSARHKRRYTIGEVSELFGIGTDSLRYYERLGVLTPKRASNGYRLFDLEDMYKLSLIKGLRSLDVPLADIKEHFRERDLQKTVDLLNDEARRIQLRIDELEQTRRDLLERAAKLQAAKGAAVGEPTVEQREERRCVELAARIELDAEMDLLMQRLHRSHEGELPDLGMLEVGGALNVESLAAGHANVYDAVFFVLRNPAVPCDFVLPAGRYLTLRYRGPYEQNGKLYRSMVEYAQGKGLAIHGKPFEIFEVDNRSTSDEREFLTRIELHVRP